jgi:WhiB family redox-sensing transcriptional regulator
MQLLGEYALLERNFKWMDDAACKGVDTSVFHPERGGNRFSVQKAKQYCYKCPVYKECMRFAIVNGINHGIWGGLTPEERRRTPEEIINDFKP